MKTTSLLLLFLLPWFASAQVYKGIVTDSQTSEPLPYASVGVRGKSIGCITDLKGYFLLDLSGATPSDSVIVSYLGYKSVALAKHQIGTNAHDIKLIPVSYQLREATATGKREIIVIGNKGHGQRYTGWGDYNSLKGRLRGVAIEPDEFPLQLSRFAMRLHDNEFDSVRVRLHILPLKADYTAGPEIELLHENIFFTCHKNQKWVYLDLRSYNIIIKTGIIVAAEWLDSWGGEKPGSGGSKLFTFSVSNKDGYTYIRKTPEEPFTVVKGSNSPTMYFETFRVGKQN